MQLTLTKPMQDLFKSALADPNFCPKLRKEAQIAADASLDQKKQGVSLGLLRESCNFFSEQQPGKNKKKRYCLFFYIYIYIYRCI